MLSVRAGARANQCFMEIQPNSEPPQNPLTGNLVFYQNTLPPLGSGNYKLTVEHAVGSKKGKFKTTNYENINEFAVQGPRFSLEPSNLSSVYPAENNSGEYANVFPHVCFNRDTLPWERGAGTVNGLEAMADVAPWLALLIIAEDEQEQIKISQVSLLDLLDQQYSTPDGEKGKLPTGYLYPGFNGPDHNQLEYDQNWTDQCVVIDMPIALFNSIAPAYADLPWLAHVREIQPTNTQSALYLQKLKTASTATVPPRLSTVIGNRLPEEGTSTLNCLVSFENWAPYLPDEDGNASSNLPPVVSHVRLVLMYQWQFYAVKQDQTFTGYLMNLNKKDGKYTDTLLQLPVNEGVTDEDKAINTAFSMGYAPLNHHTRQGDHTVSWYRGPLLPFENKGEIDIPVPGPDSATAYNPDTGMFDVSYAAALQLGRLLALQNNNFAETLYNWKRENTQQAIAAFEEEIIRKTLEEIVNEGTPVPLPPIQLVNRSLSKILSEFVKHNNISKSYEIE